MGRQHDTPRAFYDGRPVLRWVRIAAAFALAIGVTATAADAGGLRPALEAAMAGRPGAALLMDVRTGRLLAAYDLRTAAQRLAAPGSTVKPFVLLELLTAGKVPAAERLACPRKLALAGRRLDCSHPESVGPMDARLALAWSCNNYFATLAARLQDAELRQALLRAGFAVRTGLATREATGRVTAPRSPEDRQLLALGEAGIEVTPLELLVAYRRLAQKRRQGNLTPELATVFNALEDSVAFGMAASARQSTITIAGKTGTATAPGGATHGWFAGFAPAERPQVTVVVYLEQGRGSDAAAVAGKILAAWAEIEQRRRL